MPSTMIHLLVAHTLNPTAPGPFWLGNFAPDAIDARDGYTREEKDTQHFRNTGRWASLEALAKRIGPEEPFEEGCLLHLFADAYWDEGPLKDFAQSHTSPDWFRQYRHEISLAGCWIFHHYDWMKPVWEAILASPAQSCGNPPSPSAQEVAAYRDRVYNWHLHNAIGPSQVYTPAFVDAFALETAERYRQWHLDICKSGGE
jgi:hypothetical protein